MTRLLLAIVFLVFFACTENTEPQIDAETMKKIDWQGHRGARGLLPENTIPLSSKRWSMM